MKGKILFLGVAAAGLLAGAGSRRAWKDKKRMHGLQDRVDILSDHFQLLNHWLEIKEEGKSTASYFEELGYFRIAIYGMAELAARLCEDLEGSPVRVVCGIDRDVCCTAAGMEEVYSPEDDLPQADVIVVTPYSSFDSIKTMLEKKTVCPVVSLEEVVWSI